MPSVHKKVFTSLRKVRFKMRRALSAGALAFCYIAIAVTASSKVEEEVKFDPLNLNFGRDVNLAALRDRMAGKPVDPVSMLIAEKPMEDAVWGELSAAVKTDEAAPATTERERRLRGQELSSAGFLNFNFLQSWLGTPDDSATSSPTGSNTEAPAESSTKASDPGKPVRTTLNYFEKKEWVGNEECEIKPGTTFRSLTVGTGACYPSAASNEHKSYWTQLDYMEAKDPTYGQSYTVTVREYVDETCHHEVPTNKRYAPLLEVEPKNCYGTTNEQGVMSQLAVHWDLSHAPHREKGPHDMSISLSRYGKDCLLGNIGETLQERVTYSYGSEICHPYTTGGASYSFTMKCVQGGDVSFKFFKNPSCSGSPDENVDVSREDLCKARWALDYTVGAPVVQCWVNTV